MFWPFLWNQGESIHRRVMNYKGWGAFGFELFLEKKNEDKLKNKLTKSRGNNHSSVLHGHSIFLPSYPILRWLCFPSVKGICLFERTTGGTFDRCVSNYVKFFVKSHLCHLSIIITCRKTLLTALHNALVFAVLKGS